MKLIISLLLGSYFLFASNPIILQYKGIEVEHTYLSGKKEKILIQREEDPECSKFGITPEFVQAESLASKKVPEKCKKTFVVTKGMIHPLIMDKDIETYAEIEVLDFIANKYQKEPNKYILVDSRKSSWFDYGTIPSSVNIPFDEFKYDEYFEDEYKRAYELLGVKILDNGKYDFTNAKTVVFFCNGSWCGQSSMAIKELTKKGYPKEKIKWYRGGIASWAGVSLTLTKNIETKK